MTEEASPAVRSCADGSAGYDCYSSSTNTTFPLAGRSAVFINPAAAPSRASIYSALRPLIPAAGLCGPAPRRHNLGSCPRPSHSYFIGYTCVKFTILTRRDRAFPPTSRSCDCRLFRVSRNCGTRPCAALRSPLLPGRRGENFQITVILACKNRDEAVAAARQPCFRSSAFCCFSLLS